MKVGDRVLIHNHGGGGINPKVERFITAENEKGRSVFGIVRRLLDGGDSMGVEIDGLTVEMGGHTLGGAIQQPSGQWIISTNLEVVVEKEDKQMEVDQFHIGDKVKITKTRGFSAPVIAYIDDLIANGKVITGTIRSFSTGGRVGVEIDGLVIGHDLNGAIKTTAGQWVHPQGLELIREAPKGNKVDKPKKKAIQREPIHIKITIEGLAVGSNAYDMGINTSDASPMNLGILGSYTYDDAEKLLSNANNGDTHKGVLGNQYHRVALVKKYGRAVMKLARAAEALSKKGGRILKDKQ